jgi:hypothetical protein
MNYGSLLTKLLIFQYVLVAGAYGYQRDWPRCGYFLSATGISIAVLCMGKP